MKRNIIIVISLIVVILFIYNKLTNYSTALKLNWNIKLPSSAKITEIYENSAEPNCLGDGVRYHIFSYKKEELIKKMFNWSTEETELLYCDSYSQCINEWLNKIETPKEYFPDCSTCKYWYDKQEDNSEIIIIWDDKKDKLYVIESFL